jgi:hypothetical protein
VVKGRQVIIRGSIAIIEYFMKDKKFGLSEMIKKGRSNIEYSFKAIDKPKTKKPRLSFCLVSKRYERTVRNTGTISKF